MKFSLYPWNNYILFSAMIALVICIGIFIKRALHALKTITSFSPALQEINQKLAVVEEKSGKASQSINSALSGLKNVITLLITFNTLKHAYQNQSSTGFKGINQAAKSVVKSQSTFRKIINWFKKR